MNNDLINDLKIQFEDLKNNITLWMEIPEGERDEKWAHRKQYLEHAIGEVKAEYTARTGEVLN